jgi:hypothetical protein
MPGCRLQFSTSHFIFARAVLFDSMSLAVGLRSINGMVR